MATTSLVSGHKEQALEVSADAVPAWLDARRLFTRRWRQDLIQLRQSLASLRSTFTADSNTAATATATAAASDARVRVMSVLDALDAHRVTLAECARTLFDAFVLLDGDQRRLLGGYVSQRVAAADEAVRATQKNALDVADVASLLATLVDAEWKSLVRDAEDCGRAAEESRRKAADLERAISAELQIFERQCRDVGISGRSVEEELRSLASVELPALYERAAAALTGSDDVQTALSVYAGVCRRSGLPAPELEVLRLVLAHGSPSVGVLRRLASDGALVGRCADCWQRYVASEDAAAGGAAAPAAAGGNGGGDALGGGIDWGSLGGAAGDAGDAAAIDWNFSGVGDAGAGSAPAAGGDMASIQWDMGAGGASEDASAATIDWGISVAGDGAAADSSAAQAAPATTDSPRSAQCALLVVPDLAYGLVTDLLELQAFVKRHYVSVRDQAAVGVHVPVATSEAEPVSLDRLRLIAEKHLAAVVEMLTNASADRLLLLHASREYVQRLTASVDAHRLTAQRLQRNRDTLEATARQSAQKLASVRAQQRELADLARKLAARLEAEVPPLLRGQRVRIVGLPVAPL